MYMTFICLLFANRTLSLQWFLKEIWIILIKTHRSNIAKCNYFVHQKNPYFFIYKKNYYNKLNIFSTVEKRKKEGLPQHAGITWYENNQPDFGDGWLVNCSPKFQKIRTKTATTPPLAFFSLPTNVYPVPLSYLSCLLRSQSTKAFAWYINGKTRERSKILPGIG